MRVYIPLTLRQLQEVHNAGELGSANGGTALAAFGVTPELTEWCSGSPAERGTSGPGTEELEYAALGQAARESLRMLAEEAGGEGRRVVVAAEVPDGAVRSPETLPSGAAAAEPGRLWAEAPVPLAKVAAVHVDGEEAAADVAAAAAAVSAADAGDEAAERTVEEAEDHELMWYATQEIPLLLRRG